jgi:hypothetical protein
VKTEYTTEDWYFVSALTGLLWFLKVRKSTIRIHTYTDPTTGVRMTSATWGNSGRKVAHYNQL